MDTTKLKNFATAARRSLIDEVTANLSKVLAEGSSAQREHPEAIKSLQKALKQYGEEQLIERVAYIWFNRICALRFMDVNRHTRVGVVSPLEGHMQPEILAEAKMGNIDEEQVPSAIRQRVMGLLSQQITSEDGQAEAYRLLLVATCNYWNGVMPFLFQRIDDYTELLMPVDLLSATSILAHTREALAESGCQDVEVIGWLYQFYIAEKKDEVFDSLKKRKKIEPESIPAATQLFTPNWIVRYLVQNSLGGLWLLNKPESSLDDEMEYYIPPEKPETDFLKVNSPEELKVCDPACGSGHMLTYAFDLLYSIYEEEGYSPRDIPELILTHNLYGIEIDERAGELAAFALTMKARSRYRRFFRKHITPNICVLEKVQFTEQELDEYISMVGPDLFTEPLKKTLHQFEEADNFGSLIQPALQDVGTVKQRIEEQDLAGNLLISHTHINVLKVLRMADYLTPKYHVVIANPPYMGSRGMNARLSKWANDNYKNSKSDLFAMFIERCLELVVKKGAIGMITMQSWMFLSSYEALRKKILEQNTIITMAHLGARAFDSIGGEVVSTTAFVIENESKPDYQGAYLRLVDGNSEAEKMGMMLKVISYARGALQHSSADSN